MSEAENIKFDKGGARCKLQISIARATGLKRAVRGRKTSKGRSEFTSRSRSEIYSDKK
jgi:hypothetical protein